MPRKTCLTLKHILPFLALAAFSCAPGGGPSSLLDPAPGGNTGGSTGGPDVHVAGSNRLSLNITLQVKEGQAPEMPGGTMLADAKDGTTTDSTNLYIDVLITNAGPENVYLPDQASNLALDAQINFVDLPYKKNFSHGKLKLVIGWTDGGLQASEVLEQEFDTDSTLTFSMPLTRADSFNVADNVAVYGEVLAENRFILATKVVRLAPDQAAPTDSPDLVGYVERVDLDAMRLYVSGATVVIGDTAAVYDADSTQIPLNDLHTGDNELTITGLAWGYSDFIGLTANGWEFRRIQVLVAKPVSP